MLYHIKDFNLLGEPAEGTTIEGIHKSGIADKIASRVEADTKLKGSKRIIVRQVAVRSL